MLKYSLCLLLLIIPSLFGVERKNEITEAYQKAKESVVVVKTKKSTATGVVVSKNGFIVTNYHVVKNSTSVTVCLPDKTKVKASIYIEKPEEDLVILKVEKETNPIKFANHSDILVGETVISIGNPYGFTNTVSTGIVSAVDREIPSPAGTLKELIQHSSSINPGNSGGPLLNINGELMGINVAMREGAQNISFAINSEKVKNICKQLASAE